MIRKPSLILGAMMSLALFAAPALATPVSLLPDPVDDDGRVTLGELFHDAGASAGVVVGQRVGASVMLEASQVQATARRHGLIWNNPQGLRRIVVREGGALAADATARPASASVSRPGATVEVLAYARNIATGDVIQPSDIIWTTLQAHQAPSAGPRDVEDVIGLSARRPLRAGAAVSDRDLAAPQIIARNDLVQVAYIVGGVELTVTGRATRDASVGEAVPVVNLQSGRTIDAVAVAPGRAAAGPGARLVRSPSRHFASR